MKTTHLTEWQKWSEHKQDQLISLAGHLAKGIEEAELTDEEWSALAKSMEEPIENINPVVEKKRKKKKLVKNDNEDPDNEDPDNEDPEEE